MRQSGSQSSYFKRGYTKTNFKGKRISRPVRATTTSLPALNSQQILGSKNPVIDAVSIGKDAHSTGYMVSTQKIAPTAQTAAPTGFLNAPLRGIQGGVKRDIATMTRDTFFSFLITPEDGKYNKVISMSRDTSGYFKPLLEAIAIARKTSASYLPILQMNFDPNFPVSNKSGVIMSASWVDKTTSTTEKLYHDIATVNPASLADAFGVSQPDMATALYVHMADKDVSRLAYELQLFIDVCFNNYEKYAQVFWLNRDTIREIYAYTRRSAVQKPVQNLASILKSQSMQLCTGTFYNYSDYQISRTQQVYQASTSPLKQVNISYSSPIKIGYLLSTNAPQTVELFPSILPQVYTSKSVYNSIPMLDFSYTSNNVKYHWTTTNNYTFDEFFDAITTNNVDAALTFIDNIVAKIQNLIPTVSNKYNAVKVFKDGLGIDLGLSTTTMPLEITSADETANFVNAIDEISKLCFTSEVSVSVADSSGPDKLWVQIPDTISTQFDNTFRVPIDLDGGYPSIMNSDFFPMNLPLLRDQEYHNKYPSGVISLYRQFYTVKNELFTNTYTIAKYSTYVNNYLKFVDYMARRNLSFTYTISANSTSVTVTKRNSNILLDDLILITPDVNAVYEYGLSNSPVNRSKNLFVK